MSQKTLILVVGCHRSGTSAVAACLQAMGVDLGTDLLGPAPDNQNGFFEHRAAIAIHDTLLASIGNSWDRPPNPTQRYQRDAWAMGVRAARSIIRGLGPICAIKDPRATLFTDLWSEACKKEGATLHVLFVDRDDEGIVRSLRRRQGWSESRARDLVARYRQFTDASVPAFSMSFPDGVRDSATWKRILTDMGIASDLDISAGLRTFSRKLVHYPRQPKPWSVVVPSRSDAKIMDFVASYLAMNEGADLEDIVIVSDGLSDETRDALAGCAWVEGESTFVYARAVNMGASAARKGSDLVICGDDIRFLTMDVVQRLYEFSSGAAAIAPEVFGVCGQENQSPGKRVAMTEWLTFNCIYIPRAAWDRVGGMDERFTGYGCDDVDWCVRARDAGPLLIDHESKVEHINDPTFRAKENIEDLYRQNQAIFEEKWQQAGVSA